MKIFSLALSLALCLSTAESWAQGNVLQSGSIVKNHAAKWQSKGVVSDAGPASGGNANVGISDLPLVGTGTPLCIYDAPTTNSLGYHQLCLGANVDGTKGLISFNSFGGASPLGLIFNINGSDISFPGNGNGNVMGPNTTAINEIASFNNTSGTLIRQGAAGITDNKSTAISLSSAGFTGSSNTGIPTSETMMSWFGFSTPSAYDVSRSVLLIPAGSTIPIASGIAAYVDNQIATGVGGFPAGVGLFSAVVSDATNAKTWGINTICTDNRGQTVSAGTGRACNNEFDFNITSPNTTVLGLQLAGSSITQPSSAIGIALQPLDSPNFGTIARWSSFLTSVAGSTNVFASIGAKAHTGNSIKSQDIFMFFKDSVGADGSVALTGSETGGLEVFAANSLARAVTIIGTGGRFAVGDQGGFNINGRVVLIGNGASFSVGSDTNYTTQLYSNASAATSILGTSINLNGPVSVTGSWTNGIDTSAGTYTGSAFLLGTTATRSKIAYDTNNYTNLNSGTYQIVVGNVAQITAAASGVIFLPTLATHAAGLSAVCIDNATGQLYKVVAGAC